MMKYFTQWEKQCLFAIVVILYSLFLSAQAKADSLGLGTISCVDVAKDFRRSPTATRMLYYTWFAGFATGVNIMSDRQKALRLNADDRWAQLARYCDQHPLAYFQDAAMWVVNDLPYKDDDEKIETKKPAVKFK